MFRTCFVFYGLMGLTQLFLDKGGVHLEHLIHLILMQSRSHTSIHVHIHNYRLLAVKQQVPQWSLKLYLK